jgi:mRNA interferase MazF
MENVYDEWNSVKKRTEKKENRVGFKEREIFWVRLGQNIGSEEFGKGNEFQRPVLILRKLTRDIFMGLPLTSTLKDNDYFYTFMYETKRGTVHNSAMILQLKTFDKKRLMTRIGMVNKKDYNHILKKVRDLFISPSK